MQPILWIFGVLVAAILIGSGNAERRCRYFPQDLDPFHDIQKLSGIPNAESCCQQCLAHPSCRGFTNTGTNCWLKWNNSPFRNKLSTTSGIIEEIPDEKTQHPGQHKVCRSLGINNNLDPGHDLKMTTGIYSFDACCSLCKADQSCTGFVNNVKGECWFKYQNGPIKPDNPKWQTHSGLIEWSSGPDPNPNPNPNPNPTPKPLVCLNPVEREEAVKFANSIADVVDKSITAFAFLFNDPAKKAEYLNVKDKVFEALKNGWSAPGVCDAIANPIADPFNQIPTFGTIIVNIVKPAVKLACEARKKELGC